MKLPTGPRTIYVTQDLSDAIGEISFSPEGRAQNFSSRVMLLCQLGAYAEKNITIQPMEIPHE